MNHESCQLEESSSTYASTTPMTSISSHQSSLSLSSLSSDTLVKPKRLCMYFHSPNGCRNGDNCRFAHDYNSISSQSYKSAHTSNPQLNGMTSRFSQQSFASNDSNFMNIPSQNADTNTSMLSNMSSIDIKSSVNIAQQQQIFLEHMQLTNNGQMQYKNLIPFQPNPNPMTLLPQSSPTLQPVVQIPQIQMPTTHQILSSNPNQTFFKDLKFQESNLNAPAFQVGAYLNKNSQYTNGFVNSESFELGIRTIQHYENPQFQQLLYRHLQIFPMLPPPMLVDIPHGNPIYSIDVECVATGIQHNARSVAQVALVDEWSRPVFNVLIQQEKPVLSYLTPLTGLNKESIDHYGLPLGQ